MAESTDKQEVKKVLISFESGHYKTITGKWKGDSVWTHFEKGQGKFVHVNKEKVEYYEDV